MSTKTIKTHERKNALFILDLPDMYRLLTQVKNDCDVNLSTASARLNQLFDLHTQAKKSGRVRDPKVMKALEMIINARLRKPGMTLLPTKSEQPLYYLQYIPKKARKDIMNLSPNNVQLLAAISNIKNIPSCSALSIGINDESAQISIVLYVPETQPDTNRVVLQYETLAELKTICGNIATSRSYVLEDWLNVSFNSIFPTTNELTNSSSQTINKVYAYYSTHKDARTLYTNTQIQTFAAYLGLEEVKTTCLFSNVVLKIKYDASRVPLSLAKMAEQLDEIEIDCTVLTEALDYLPTQDWHQRITDIVNVQHRASRRKDVEKLALCLAVYAGTLEINKCVPNPTYDLSALVSQITKTISDCTYVIIAANKGSGKSTLINTLPNDKYIVVDSDVKGEFITKIKESPELEKFLKQGDYANPQLLDLLSSLLVENDSNANVTSAYEVECEKFVKQNNLEMRTLVDGRATTRYYREFMSKYDELNRFVDGKNSGFAAMVGNLLAHYYSIDKNSSYSKVIHFVHNQNEAYFAMTPAIYGIESNMLTVPIHLERKRKTSPETQMFLYGFYSYTDSLQARMVPQYVLRSAFSRLANN